MMVDSKKVVEKVQSELADSARAKEQDLHRAHLEQQRGAKVDAAVKKAVKR